MLDKTKRKTKTGPNFVASERNLLILRFGESIVNQPTSLHLQGLEF